MIFEFDWNRVLFVGRSRGLKKRYDGGSQSPELDDSSYRQNIYSMKLKFIFSLLEYLVYRILGGIFQKYYIFHLWSIFTDIRSVK